MGKNIGKTAIILIGFLVCIGSGCTDSSKQITSNKYTKSDYMFISNASSITNNITKYLNDAATEFKKYPDTNFDIVFNNYQKIIDEVNKANTVVKPENFIDTYNIWIKSLNEYKVALEMSREGFKNKDIKIISQSNKLIESASKTMEIATGKAKINYEELKMYYNESKMEGK